METHRSRFLFVLAGLFVLTVVGSWLGVRFLASDWLSSWGYVLFAALLLWAGGSVGLLLPSASMEVRLLIGVCLLAAVIAGLFAPGAGFVALFVVVGGVIVVLLVALVRVALTLFRRSSTPALHLLGFVPVLAGVLVVGVAIVTHWAPAVPAKSTDASAELAVLAATDQLDRTTGHFVLNARRDHERLRRVQQLDQQGAIMTPADHYHAALVLQHGECPPDWRRAYELAYAAVQAGYSDPSELWKGAYDRWMLSLGQPAKYGTQLSVSVSSSCVTSHG